MKKPWLFRVHRGSYYPAMWGLQWTIIRIPVKQPVFHGKYPSVFVAQVVVEQTFVWNVQPDLKGEIPFPIWVSWVFLQIGWREKKTSPRNAWNPNDPCFGCKRPSFGGFNPQNKGQTGSRCVLMCLWLLFVFDPWKEVGNFWSRKKKKKEDDEEEGLLHSLKLTASLPLKTDGWNTRTFPIG